MIGVCVGGVEKHAGLTWRAARLSQRVCGQAFKFGLLPCFLTTLMTLRVVYLIPSRFRVIYLIPSRLLDGARELWESSKIPSPF